MPARLLITEGPRQLPPRLIEQEVVRIGSSPRCDVRLERIPPHALTVFYRQEEFFVINKSDLLLDLDGDPILPGETRRFVPGCKIALGPKTAFAIEVADDPAPRSPTGADDPEQAFDESDARARARRRRRSYLTITGACIAILGAWAVGNHAPHDARQNRPGREAEYERLVVMLDSNPSYTQREFVPFLARARAAEVRKDNKTAAANYHYVLRKLADERGNPINHDPTLDRVVRYAKGGLLKLCP